MPRNLTANVQSEVAKDQIFMVHFLELYFDSGTKYYTNGNIPLTWNSNIYLPSADFVTFGSISETQGLELNSLIVTMSGADQTLLAEALTEDFIDRNVIIRAVFINTTTYAIIDDPAIIYEGQISNFKFSENGQGSDSTLTWTVKSAWADFDRTSGRRTNNYDQQVFFPGDIGFQFAHQMNFDIKWGRK